MQVADRELLVVIKAGLTGRGVIVRQAMDRLILKPSSVNSPSMVMMAGLSWSGNVASNILSTVQEKELSL